MSAQAPRTQVQCNGQVISEIVIRSQAPSYGGLFARSAVLGRLVTSMHVATTPAVVENFILMKRGDRCSPRLRLESERLLRAQPFLADASVTAYPDPAQRGAVRLEVATVDEPSVLGAIGVRSVSPYLRALSFGSGNVDGRAVSVLGGWRDGFYYRDTWRVQYANYQLFSRPYQMHVSAVRRDLGYEWANAIAYPFFSDVQPRAWRLAGGASEDLIPFRSPTEHVVALPVKRQFLGAGGVVRVGTPGRLGLVGLSFTEERAGPSASGTIVTKTGLVSDSSGALDNRYQGFRTARLNLLLGYRQVNFLRVSGFDALTGVQDMRRGVQASLAVGRSLRLPGTPTDEVFAAGSVYGGLGSRTSFIGLEVLGEGRLDAATEQWDGLLLSGRLGWYLKPHPRQTVAGSIEFGAGRRQRLPFQLALGERRGGVRGYEGAELGGAQRVAARLEERWRIGNIRGTADAGVALFGDVGRLWAGDVPMGRNTGWMPSLGVGVLAAVPPRSRRLWRMDVAFPLRREAGAHWSVRISNADRTRDFWIEPNDLRRAHERAMTATSFDER